MVRFSVHEEEKFRPVWNAISGLIREPVSDTMGTSKSPLYYIK